jgi:hypothetical protein
MTREDVIRMAREAKLNIGPAGMGQTVWGGDAELKRFAVLVAAAEREACAKVCESLEEQCEKLLVPDEKWPTPADCASVIRARSKL